MERRELDFNVHRAAARAQLSERSTLLAAVSHADRDERQVQEQVFAPLLSSTQTIDDSRDGWLGELQLIHQIPTLQLIGGIEWRRTDYTRSSLTEFVSPFFSFQVSDENDEVIRSQSAYLYADWLPTDTLTVTLGLSKDRHRDPNQGTSIDYSQLNPKAGVQWQLAPFANLRAAYIETTKHQLVSEATLQPTRIAGFTQFMDDPNHTKARLKGAALDLTLSDSLSATIEHTYRETDVIDSMDFYIDRRSRGALVAIINDRWTASVGYERRNNNVDLNQLPFTLRTELVPVKVNYTHPKGYFGRLGWTRFDQDWSPDGEPTISSHFDAVDLSAGYRWNRNRYKVMVGVDDLLDDVETYRDDRHMINDQFNVYRPFVPGRTIWGSIQMAWD
jgi:outer membrane receptor protein involved in Fe transport